LLLPLRLTDASTAEDIPEAFSVSERFVFSTGSVVSAAHFKTSSS
jgi:hypothetical protein